MANVDNLYEKAKGLSREAEELFAQRDSLRDQARQVRASYQPRIDTLKEEADQLAEQFKALYRESQEAYSSGDGSYAKELASDAHEKQEECEELNREARNLISELQGQVRTLYDEADAKHQEAMACIHEAKRLREQAKQIAQAGFRASDPHGPSKKTPFPHVDVEKFDKYGRKVEQDEDGEPLKKLKITYDKNKRFVD